MHCFYKYLASLVHQPVVSYTHGIVRPNNGCPRFCQTNTSQVTALSPSTCRYDTLCCLCQSEVSLAKISIKIPQTSSIRALNTGFWGMHTLKREGRQETGRPPGNGKAVRIWEGRQDDCSGRHWRRWRQASTSPMAAWAVILTFPFPCIMYEYKTDHHTGSDGSTCQVVSYYQATSVPSTHCYSFCDCSLKA